MTSISREDLSELSLDEISYGEGWVVDGAFGPPFAGSWSVYLHHLDDSEPIAVAMRSDITLRHGSYNMPADLYMEMLLDACKLWSAPVGFRFENGVIETDTEEGYVEFSFSIRSSSNDLAEAYAVAESLLTTIVTAVRPVLISSGRRLSDKEMLHRD
jgi:hypothetical protein